MFTGLIEAVGEVRGVTRGQEGFHLRLGTRLAGELALGDSLAVNGVCLTVTSATADEIAADIGPETARITALGDLRPGDVVNLERPMRADGRFGGHFVQGHVDAAGVVNALRPDGDTHWLTVSFPPALAPCVIPKGSVALDGVSLTIATLREAEFDVMIIPYTWMHTNLAQRRVGDRVNLECDIIGKYVARAAELVAERLRVG